MNVGQFYSITPSQGYGPTGLTLEPAYQGYAHFHEGIDLPWPLGTPVPAPAAGTVTQAGWNDGYGNSVTVKLANGEEMLFGHLSVIGVKVGQAVGYGDVVGLVGSTGASTGPHLHFQLMDSAGNPIDPAGLLAAAKQSAQAVGAVLVGTPASLGSSIASGVGQWLSAQLAGLVGQTDLKHAAAVVAVILVALLLIDMGAIGLVVRHV